MKSRARKLLFYADSEPLEALIAVYGIGVNPYLHGMNGLWPNWFFIAGVVIGLAQLAAVAHGSIIWRHRLLTCAFLHLSAIVFSEYQLGFGAFLVAITVQWATTVYCVWRLSRQKILIDIKRRRCHDGK